ncbi:MAG TPA: glycoside hydrolase family 43 protein [Rhodocyclaceae bacterium]|nr:glycoside hydrolase family 43 protein [Rhodocyclaceae bacterium]
MRLKLWLGAWTLGLATTAFAATDYPSGYTKCAQVGSACAMSGTHSVALGKSGSFVYATLTGNFTCQTSLFPSNSFTTSAWCSVGPTSSTSSSVTSSVASSVASSASSSKASSSSSKASSSAASSAASSSGFWALTGDVGSHDPTLTKEGSVWYEFHTGTGIQGKRSNDGKAWSAIPQIFLSRPSWWKTYVPNHTNLDVWAPDVSTYNGRVYMYYSISTFGSNVSAIGLVSAATIGAGSWRDDGLVIRSTASNNYNAIDPNLTIDKDGNPWLVFGSFWNGIQLTKLDKSTMKPTGSLTTLATRSAGIEAPVIIYRSGYYYLFVSIDKCCAGVDSTYKIAYGRSTSITGPYLDKSGKDMKSGGGTVLDAGNDVWKGPGGQDIYGTSVIIRHAYDATDNGSPKMLINDLNWDSSGWPKY